VDGVETETGSRIMELELVDPELFFRHSVDAIERFTDRVSERLNID
jgi:hypothetical protein